MKHTIKTPDNFTQSAAVKTNTVYDTGGGFDVALGGDVLIYQRLNPLVKSKLTLNQPATKIPNPTQIIPATVPTEIRTPTNPVTLPVAQTMINAPAPQDYVPMKDPIITDKILNASPLPLKPLNTTGSLTEYAKQLREQLGRTPTVTGVKEPFPLWIILLIIGVVVGAGIYYYSRKK